MPTMHEVCELLETLPKVLRSVKMKVFSRDSYVIRDKHIFLNDLAKAICGKDAVYHDLPYNFRGYLETTLIPTRSGRGWFFADGEWNKFLPILVHESVCIRFKEYLTPSTRNAIGELLLVVS